MNVSQLIHESLSNKTIIERGEILEVMKTQITHLFGSEYNFFFKNIWSDLVYGLKEKRKELKREKKNNLCIKEKELKRQINKDGKDEKMKKRWRKSIKCSFFSFSKRERFIRFFPFYDGVLGCLPAEIIKFIGKSKKKCLGKTLKKT